MSREQFEAWFDRYHTEACNEYGGIDCSNPKGVAEEAWEAAWQAATAAAYEDAARVCDQVGPAMAERYGPGAECIVTADECAAGIRERAKEVGE